MPNEITKYFDRERTDKADNHRYDHVYALLAPLVRRQGVRADRIMELGYSGGGGIQAFQAIFHGFKFVAVDRYFPPHALEDPSLLAVRCHLGDAAQVADLAAGFRPESFAMIVDDASHLIEEQLTALRGLWSLVAPGGIYVIEDIQHPEDVKLFAEWPGYCAMDMRALGKNDSLCVVLRKPLG